MQIVLVLGALLDMQYCYRGGGNHHRGDASAVATTSQQYCYFYSYYGLPRALLIALALLGGVVTYACRTVLFNSNFLEADGGNGAVWIALLSHHFYLKSLDDKKQKKKHQQQHQNNQNNNNNNVQNNKTQKQQQQQLLLLSKDYREISYDWKRSTEENYRAHYGTKSYGKFASIRDGLDSEFHSVYSKRRQLFQDTIIESMLRKTHVHDVENGRNCSKPHNPWIVFTAGAMGAGKSHTIRLLDEKKRFPLHSFVSVDPDQIRHHLPEFDVYATKQPQKAGELTRKECGMMSEVLTKAALQHGHNVLVDGSLRNATWYHQYFQELKQTYPHLRIGIIHVTAPREEVFARALVS